MKTLLWVLVVMAGIAASNAWSQQAADHDTAGSGAGMSSPAGAEQHEGGPPRANRGPYKMPPLWVGLTHDLHNKIVHFPIVLSLVAAAMLIVARRHRQYEPVAFWLVWLAALSVIAAYFSGKAQEEEFHGKPKQWLVELHERVGIIIGITEAIWVLSLLNASTRRLAWVIGLIVASMILGEGYLGGLVAHGH